MKIFQNKTLIVIGVILMLFIFTNPDNVDFKEYLIAKGNSKRYVDSFGGKTANFFLFSIFEINKKRRHFKTPTIYKSIGILNNFIIIRDSREESEKVQ